MPPLTEIFADFKGFSPGEKRGARIYDLLLLVIQRHRGMTAQRFYPMRAVAEFFGVSLFTVLTVYRRLDREGALTRVRSSQTVIPARAPRTKFVVRGVVAMPLWLPAFLQFGDWRRWLAIIEEELSIYHFVAEPIFFSNGDEGRPAFVERVLKFNPDYLLWFCPSHTIYDIQALHGFMDTGMPLIVVSNFHQEFPGRVYPLSNDEALRQGLKEWAASGEIDRIVVPQSGATPSSATVNLRSLLKEFPLPSRFDIVDSPRRPDLPDYLAHLMAEPRTGLIFDDDLFYVRMCMWQPEIMLELFRTHRTMVMRLVEPSGYELVGTADSLSFSWRRLARRIAADLSQGKGAIPTLQATFQADWRAQTPLSELMPDI